LLGVVSQGVNYSGHYCFVDKEWRSSNRCWILGTDAVLSSEASVFIMASMSTFRLVSICKPFLTRTIKFKWIVLVGVSCWLFSLLFAFLPWIPLTSGYFVSEVWFPNHFFKTDTISNNHLITIANQVSDSNSTGQSWFKVKETISRKFRYNEIKAEFGFDSQTSVCMPRFYTSTSESSWEYSTFLITLNFMLFIYMLVVYVLVYKKATATKFSTSTKKDPNQDMQKRISRLLLTDFFCWIPVCIMAYLRVLGVILPPDAHIASAGFLLPINSAMNPLLYSKLTGLGVRGGGPRGAAAPPGLKNFRPNSVFRASASCSKILNSKKYIQYSEKFQGNLCFQGKRKLLKILNVKSIFTTAKISRAALFFRASASCSKTVNLGAIRVIWASVVYSKDQRRVWF